jgi:hypothetical protein
MFYEVWLKVPGVPGMLASSDGRLMAESFVRKMPRGGTVVHKGKAWTGTWSKEGRYTTKFRGKNYKVARLVCEAFHGPPPPGAVCMHLDENARNNRFENLAWGTQKENLNAPGFIAYCRTRKPPTTVWKERNA